MGSQDSVTGVDTPAQFAKIATFGFYFGVNQ